MPNVSIVVPNYNHAAFLKERLESIFGQTYQDFEVILLDDCSTDDSLSILSTFSEHPLVSRLLINEENSGSPFRQWIKGINAASGKYIWIAESDDVADLTFLEKLVPVLDNFPTVGVAYCQSQIIDGQGKAGGSNINWTRDMDKEDWQKQFVLDGRAAICRYFTRKNVIPNASAVLFRKNLFDSIPPSFTNFRYVGDWLVWVQLLMKSDLYFTPFHLNYFRLHSHVTRIRKTYDQRIDYFMEAYAVVEHIIDALTLSLAERKGAFDYLARKVYRKFGLRYLLSRPGYLLTKRISTHDAKFKSRILLYLLSRTKFR